MGRMGGKLKGFKYFCVRQYHILWNDLTMKEEEDNPVRPVKLFPCDVKC